MVRAEHQGRVGRSGVIYGVGFNAVLYWYKHLDPVNGATSWANDRGIAVGQGWLDPT